MSMPGFTAATSLYERSNHYYMAGSGWQAAEALQTVHPASCVGKCFQELCCPGAVCCIGNEKAEALAACRAECAGF